MLVQPPGALQVALGEGKIRWPLLGSCSHPGRGRELDAITRAAIESARGVIDSDAATAAWERALKAPAWKGTPVWIHTDLLRPNVLVRGGLAVDDGT